MSLQPPVHNESACGTYSGYTTHYRHGQTPCEPCRKARRDYELRCRAIKRSKKMLDNGVTVNAVMFAELYLAAPVPLQDQIDRHLGADTIDAIVKAHDAYVDMVQKGNAA